MSLFDPWHQRNRQDDELACYLNECFSEKLQQLVNKELVDGGDREAIVEMLRSLANSLDFEKRDT